VEGEKVGGNGERYFEARAWESVDRRFASLEQSQKDTASALQRLATVSEANAATFSNYVDRQQRFWRSWRVVITAILVGLATILIPVLTFLHSIHFLGWA
jgi:anti-sigma-K factor RskA